MNRNFKIKFFFSFFFLPLFILGGVFVFEAKAQAETQLFNINSYYDLYDRKETEATLIRTTSNLYFYIEKTWWENRSFQEQNDIKITLFDLSEEFKNKIYPVLTSTFGKEAEFGVDGDPKITVLIHPMIKEAGGYFNSGDIYEKNLYPKSNQRKMIYLNSQHIGNPEAKAFLAHEFVHLITVNQKNILREVTEEIWLNEARAEYAPTLLGYDDVYKGSNLERRVKTFLNKPSDSLTEWLNKKEDYGVINLFTQYLVDHYGLKILVDSLRSEKTGIESISYALEKNNYDKDFSRIFSDWLAALLINDCQAGEKYCYLNEHLKDLRVVPTFYYLPKSEIVLSAYHDTTYWSANWHRFVGGINNLTLEFNGNNMVDFDIPYVLCDLKENCSVEFFSLDNEQKGKITISEFDKKYNSLTIMPFVRSRTSGFNGQENYFNFSWQLSVREELALESQEKLIEELLAQIEQLKKQIAEYQAKIAAITGVSQISCQRFDDNLYYGIKDSAEVSCLQEFLKDQGPEIYPEGLITGNFLSLTQSAVIRFQEKYAQEILTSLGLEKGTGYVGPATRTKINSLISQ